VRAGVFVFAAIAAASAGWAAPDARELLDRTVWVDIGVGRTLSAMKPKEIVTLRRCKEPTLYFEKTEIGLAETFLAGIAIRTEYIHVSLTRTAGKAIVLLYDGNSSKAAEALQLTNDNTVLIQQTRGFRPHTFLRCAASPAPAKAPLARSSG
jgi:hypothetical protein